jgi:molecular chaperone GrpE
VETVDKEYSRGMELIRQRLKAELQKLGLERVPAAGQKFDPNVHHAIEMRQTDEVEDHSVLEELQTGYTFRGRLLRPAMVRVAVAPEKDPQADQRKDG